MATVLTKKGGKRYATPTAKIEPEREHTAEEAVGALQAMPGAKFDESVDLSLRLGVDPKHADQMVRGAVVLPPGLAKSIRVARFASAKTARVTSTCRPVSVRSAPRTSSPTRWP